MTDYERQQIIDLEHLRLLRIAYFIEAGLTALMALGGLLYMGIGLLISAGAFPPDSSGREEPAFVGGLLAIIGGGLFVAAIVLVVLKLLTAKYLLARRSRTLCLVTAVLTCFNVPYGTVVGIFTFIVLGRPGVRAMFDQQSGPMPPGYGAP
jgi:hypothetical protein